MRDQFLEKIDQAQEHLSPMGATISCSNETTTPAPEDKRPLVDTPTQDKQISSVTSSPARGWEKPPAAVYTPPRSQTSSANSPLSPSRLLTFDPEKLNDILLIFLSKDNDHTKRTFHKLRMSFEDDPSETLRSSSYICSPDSITQRKIFKSDFMIDFRLNDWIKRTVCQECGGITSEDKRGSKYTRIILSSPLRTKKEVECKTCQRLTQHSENVYFNSDRFLLESDSAQKTLTLPCGREYTLYSVLYLDKNRYYKVAFRDDDRYFDQNKQTCIPSEVEHTVVMSHYMIKQAPKSVTQEGLGLAGDSVGPKGFRNEGNTCYINSTLQILKKCLSFGQDVDVSATTTSNVQRVISNEITECDFVNFMEAAMKKSLRQQFDAALFLDDLLRMIFSELPAACDKIILAKWQRYYGCEHGRKDFGNLNDKLSLLIDTDQSFENVQQGIEHSMNGSRSCNTVEDCTMTNYSNFTPPEFLIVTMLNMYDRPLRCTVEEDIKIATSPSGKGKEKYVLRGVVFHIGSSYKSGHYIAQVQHDQRWYTISDQHVTECTEDERPWLSSFSPSICLFERFRSEQ